MPTGIKQIQDETARQRTVEGMQRLHRALSAAIPARSATDTLLLATWNIREFDSGKYGYRVENLLSVDRWLFLEQFHADALAANKDT